MSKYVFDLQLFNNEDTAVDVDTLKDHFTDDELQEYLPKEEPAKGTPTDPTETAPVDPPAEETVVGDVTTGEDIPSADGVSKHVPYDRFKEVNEKNKVLAAELAALKAKNTQPSPQPTQQPAPVQQQQPINVEEQITKLADEKVRKALNITDNIETLQYTDPGLYLKYVKDLAKEEFRLETQYEQQAEVYHQNITFANELKSQEDFPVLFQFAVAELDELPGRKARVIEAAFNNIDRGMGSKEDIETVRNFANECRAKMTGTAPQQQTPIEPEQKPNPQQAPSPLDKAAGLPRATNLGGARTAAMSWAQVEQLAAEGKFDQIPKDMLIQIDPKLVE
jgi:hypothetical protein